MTDSEPTAYAVQHIRDALAGDGRTSELGVDVNVTGNGVFLSGVVSSPEQRVAVESVVAELVDGKTLHNDVAVLTEADPDVEVLR